ncbi:hypothetical protein ACLOJK_036993 [Asimina triloba]
MARLQRGVRSSSLSHSHRQAEAALSLSLSLRKSNALLLPSRPSNAPDSPAMLAQAEWHTALGVGPTHLLHSLGIRSAIA